MDLINGYKIFLDNVEHVRYIVHRVVEEVEEQ